MTTLADDLSPREQDLVSDAQAALPADDFCRWLGDFLSMREMQWSPGQVEAMQLHISRIRPRRQPVPSLSRRIAQIAAADGVLYALASDGTLWWMNEVRNEWKQDKPLPQPE